MGVPVARSRLFACLALLLWATVGLLAEEHCVCADVASACEHAGQACAEPDDCSDCLVPHHGDSLMEAPLAFLPPLKGVVCLVRVSAPLTFAPRLAAVPNASAFSSALSTYRPPALRAGTMSLRL
jgi:hypothetical protein